MTTKKDSLNNAVSQRILVVVVPAGNPSDNIFEKNVSYLNKSATFDDVFTRLLQRCKVSAAFVYPAALDLGDPVAEKSKKFLPDTILTIKLISWVGMHQVYELRLTDASGKKLVWNSTLNILATIVKDVESAFPKTIIDHLRDDGVIPKTCSTA